MVDRALKEWRDEITDRFGADDPTVAFINAARGDGPHCGEGLTKAALGAGRVRLDLPPCERCRRIREEFDVYGFIEEKSTAISVDIARDISEMIKEVKIELESKMLREDCPQIVGPH